MIVVEPGGIKTEWADIARTNLMKVSGNTDYKNTAQKFARLLGTSDKIASDPDVVAKVIEKSILVKKPKTRYVVGAGAKLFLFLRKILSDRMFDRVQTFLMNSAARYLS